MGIIIQLGLAGNFNALPLLTSIMMPKTKQGQIIVIAPLVAGCSVGHKFLSFSMLADGAWVKLKTRSTR